jgi:hypothetical protein
MDRNNAAGIDASVKLLRLMACQLISMETRIS